MAFSAFNNLDLPPLTLTTDFSSHHKGTRRDYPRRSLHPDATEWLPTRSEPHSVVFGTFRADIGPIGPTYLWLFWTLTFRRVAVSWAEPLTSLAKNPAPSQLLSSCAKLSLVSHSPWWNLCPGQGYVPRRFASISNSTFLVDFDFRPPAHPLTQLLLLVGLGGD